MASRDVESEYSVAQFAAKLRRLADALEADRPFRIQIAGERIRVPGGGDWDLGELYVSVILTGDEQGHPPQPTRQPLPSTRPSADVVDGANASDDAETIVAMAAHFGSRPGLTG